MFWRSLSAWLVYHRPPSSHACFASRLPLPQGCLLLRRRKRRRTHLHWSRLPVAFHRRVSNTCRTCRTHAKCHHDGQFPARGPSDPSLFAFFRPTTAQRLDGAGTTSDRQAGQWNVPSGKERISGWPHSQACLPIASGRATICLSVPMVTPSKARQQDSHSAERESGPRLRSAPYPQAGQTRCSRLDVDWAGPLVRLIATSPVLVPDVARPSCEKEPTSAVGVLHHPPRCFTRVIL